MILLYGDEWESYYKAKSKRIAVCILIYVMAASRFSLLARMSNVARYLILIGFLFVGVSKKERARVDFLPAILFSIAAVPSLIGSSFFFESLIKIVSVVFLFISLSAYFSSNSGNATRLLFNALLVVSVVSLMLNIFTLVTGSGMFYGMFRGFFANRNSNGPTLVITLMVLYGALKKSRRKIPIAILIVLNVYMIILTGSRGAFLGMCIGTGFFVYLSLEKKIVAPFLAGAIAALITTFWRYISKLEPVTRIINEGIQREDLWPYALAKLKENPLFGTGFGVNALGNTDALTVGMNYHNSYLDILVSVGCFGTIIIVLLFVIIGWKIVKSYSYIECVDRKIEFVTLAAICVAFLGLSFGEGYLLAAGSPFCFIFWCCIFALQYV